MSFVRPHDRQSGEHADGSRPDPQAGGGNPQAVKNTAVTRLIRK